MNYWALITANRQDQCASTKHQSHACGNVIQRLTHRGTFQLVYSSMHCHNVLSVNAHLRLWSYHLDIEPSNLRSLSWKRALKLLSKKPLHSTIFFSIQFLKQPFMHCLCLCVAQLIQSKYIKSKSSQIMKGTLSGFFFFLMSFLNIESPITFFFKWQNWWNPCLCCTWGEKENQWFATLIVHFNIHLELTCEM